MSDKVIRVENLGKRYQLGMTHTNLLSERLGNGVRSLRQRLLGREAVARPSRSASPEPDEFWALRDVSFEVRQGDVVGIIGRNGAGKSTLLKILSRITSPTTGQIEIFGRVASLLEVGTGFHPELTGRENIYLNGAILGMTKAEVRRKFDEIVDFAEVEKFIDTPVKRYSSGMYVRLAFAVAAHLEPEILIVDEVLAVGDAAFQKKCLGKMQDVSNEGRTVLFVSHNMAAIERLTKNSIFLCSGTMKLYGETSEIIKAYLGAADAESAVCFNVEKTPRKYLGNQMARFVELRFDRDIPLFHSDENFEFVARVKTNADIDDIRFSMTVFANDGTPVGSCFGPAFANMQTGFDMEFRITLPNPGLAPGMYYCGVAVGKGDHTTGHVDFDVVHDTLAFEVRPAEGESGTLSRWARGWGAIVFPPLSQQLLSADK